MLRRLLAAIPDAPSGLRDRAIVITLASTGRRRSEVLNLKARDITQDGGAASMESANYRDRRSRPEFPPRSRRGRHVQLAPVRVYAITLTMKCRAK
jgi:integrase